MIFIGERINGMFTEVKEAIQKKDRAAIQALAKRQAEAGANMLDVNVGPASSTPVETVAWLVEAIEEVTDKTICIDTPKIEVMKAGLAAVKKNPKCINSSKATDKDLSRYMPLAKEYNSSIIGLAMDERGLPQDVNGRVEAAAKVLASAMEHDVDMDKVFLDPIIFPLNCAQPQAVFVLEAIKQFTILNSPPPHITIGLSNVSQGAIYRKLINRIFLVMAVQNGLDSAIVDVLDQELVDATITAELLMNKTIYSDSYIKAYHASH